MTRCIKRLLWKTQHLLWSLEDEQDSDRWRHGSWLWGKRRKRNLSDIWDNKSKGTNWSSQAPKVLPEFLLPSDYIHGKWNHSQKAVFTQLLLVSSLLPASPSLSLLQPLKYSQISPEGVSILYAFLLLFPLAWKRLSLIHVNSYWSLKVKFKYKLLSEILPGIPTPS